MKTKLVQHFFITIFDKTNCHEQQTLSFYFWHMSISKNKNNGTSSYGTLRKHETRNIKAQGTREEGKGRDGGAQNLRSLDPQTLKEVNPTKF